MIVTVIQCKPKGFKPLSWLIRLVQWTNYSHYAIELNDEDGYAFFVHSTSNNMAPIAPEFFFSHYEVTKEFEIGVSYPENVVRRWLSSMYGTPYAVLQILGIKLRIKRLGFGADKMICNELILRFLNRFSGANIKDIDILDLNQTEKQLIKHLR